MEGCARCVDLQGREGWSERVHACAREEARSSSSSTDSASGISAWGVGVETEAWAQTCSMMRTMWVYASALSIWSSEMRRSILFRTKHGEMCSCHAWRSTATVCVRTPSTTCRSIRASTRASLPTNDPTMHTSISARLFESSGSSETYVDNDQRAVAKSQRRGYLRAEIDMPWRVHHLSNGEAP